MKFYVPLFFTLLIAFVILYLSTRNQPAGGSYSSLSPTPANVAGVATGSAHLGIQTKTFGCTVNGALPDEACTPGAIFPNVTKEQICIKGYASSVRNVPASEKRDVYAEYGILSHTTGEYEVDHLISLELGGSNDIANLWPEAAEPRPGFHEKDWVENELHQEVCDGMISLEQAQQIIASDWWKFYTQHHL